MRPGPSQPTGRLPVNRLQDAHRARDHRGLVRLLVDRALLVGVAHELPAGVLRLLGDARIVLAHARIDRERRADAEPREQIEEAPHADAHAVFVPAPVRHVGQHRLPGRRRQHLPRHRLADVPHFEVHDGPEHDARAAGQLQRRPVDDRRIVDALARECGHWRSPAHWACARGIGAPACRNRRTMRSSGTTVRALERRRDALRILIVGAGIGGLTAALALLRDGHDGRGLRAGARSSPSSAPACRSRRTARACCSRSGWRTRSATVWCEPAGKEIRLWNTGETWKLFDLGAESVARYGAPYFMMHRADLHAVLIDAVRALEPDAIRLDARCTGFDDDGNSVTLASRRWRARRRRRADRRRRRALAHPQHPGRRRQAGSSPAAWRGAGWCRWRSCPRTCGAMSASTGSARAAT